MTKFQVDDVVIWGGVEGYVTSVTQGAVEVHFPAGGSGTILFEPDGRRYCWHTKPSLELVSRPLASFPRGTRKKVQMYREVYKTPKGELYSTNNLHSIFTPFAKGIHGVIAVEVEVVE